MTFSKNFSGAYFTQKDRYKIVRFLGLSAIAGNLIYLLTAYFTDGLNPINATLAVLSTISFLITIYMYKRAIPGADFLFLLMIHVIMATALLLSGSITGPTTSIYILLVIVMGVLLDQKGIIFTIFLSLLAIILTHGLDVYGFLIDPELRQTGLNSLSYILAILFSGLVMYLIMGSFKYNLSSMNKLINVVEQNPLAVVIFNKNGKIEYINQAFAQISGYSQADVQTQNVMEVSQKLLSRQVYDEFWQTILSGKSFSGEYLAMTKSGIPYHAHSTVSPIFDSDGRISHFAAVNENISARKQADLSLRKAHSDLQEKLTEITELKNQLMEQNVRDPLTNIYNRRFFNEIIERELSRAERSKDCLSLIILDADNLKTVNDTYGHLAGDEVLIKLSNFLVENVRKMDYVCRYGGDEFVIVMPGACAQDALLRAETLRKGFYEYPLIIEDQKFNLTSSFGICTYPNLAQNVDQLISRADIALYVAKRSGKNLSMIWNSGINFERKPIPR